MFISREKYQELVDQKNNNELVEAYESDLKRLKDELSDLRKDHNREIEKIIWQGANEVTKAKEAQLAEIATLKLTNGTQAKEIEILNKAFENMGFDVKDMKEILNKLVDGVVAKNQIQLVK